MKKEQLTIEFTDGTKGLLTLETIKGRVDAKAEYEDVRVYYLTEKVGNKWLVKRCNDGRCYDTVTIAEKTTRKEAVAEIIFDVRKNQVRTAHTYILDTTLGAVFEVVATSESLAKKCVRFKCSISEEKIHTKEIKEADEAKQKKAKIGGYADFIKQILPAPTDEPKAEEAEAEYRTYKGYTITGNERTGIVALDPYGHFSSKVYKTEEVITDIEKDIAESVPIEETASFVVPVEDDEPAEVIEKAHEILSNPLTELDVKTSVMKSAFNRYYDKQVIDAEMNMKKTELNGFHVSGVITETDTMMLSCDIYAQDLDIEESYLAYKVGNAYAVYDEISLTRISIYADSDAVKQFFVSRVKALEAETIKTLY